MQHRVGQQIDRHARVFARQIDVIHRAIKRRVSVNVTAMGLDLGRDFPPRAPRRALEQHVFEIMRKPRAEVLAFVNTPRFHPDLHRGQRSRTIGFQDQRDPIWQNRALDGFTPKWRQKF